MKYRGADKSLARPGRKQARKHVRDPRDFNNIETRAVIKFPFLQGKAPKEIHAILKETLDYFLPVRTKDLSARLSNGVKFVKGFVKSCLCICQLDKCISRCKGDRGSTVVKVLCYKSEGHWLDPSWCQWIFSLT